MANKDYFLVDGGTNNIYSQMLEPFYALSNLLLNAVNPQTDGVDKDLESKNGSLTFTLEASKSSSKVYSILEQKAMANELGEYIAKLVEQDIEKTETEKSKSLFNNLREEFLTEINLLKQEFAAIPIEKESDNANDLRASLSKLGEEKLDKIEFQTLLSSFRSEILEQITLLKNELAIRPTVSENPVTAVDFSEEASDIKEGQLLESNRITGTIKEVIDVDF
ncbi:MAG: hypothetical protein Q8935_15555 [Bacillota bacterium]|nr:hypothetical protein [Bacillota bacterium]